MPDDSETEIHRRNIGHYNELLGTVTDPEIRRRLERLLKEAQDRLSEIDPDRRS
jgi:hypothetical protein